MAMPLMIHVWSGTPRLRLWCPKCLLPSGAEVEMFRVTMSGLTTLGMFRRCTQCLRPVERETR